MDPDFVAILVETALLNLVVIDFTLEHLVDEFHFLRQIVRVSQFGPGHGEQFLFGERAGIYRGLSVDDCVSTYAERIESIIGSEATSWSGAEKAPQGGEGG